MLGLLARLRRGVRPVLSAPYTHFRWSGLTSSVKSSMYIVAASPGARPSSGAALKEDFAADRPPAIPERTRIHAAPTELGGRCGRCASQPFPFSKRRGLPARFAIFSQEIPNCSSRDAEAPAAFGDSHP